ncbi:MAG: LpxL/LpxP family Kdo(2)-lipid IV(A) lauroyl/palmitoleoyl acyltransferase [Pseudomonadota bacterium]
MGEKRSELFQAKNYLSPRHWPMWVVIGFLKLLSMLPYRLALKTGRGLGTLLHLINASRRRVVDINLRRCFPDMTSQERHRINRSCFQNIGVSVVETAMCWWWQESKFESLVEIVGREHIDSAISQGQGVILLTGHFTSLEIGARLLALYMPVQVMYRTQRNPFFDSYLYTRRTRYFVNTISRKNTRQMVKGIKNLVPTWYAPDQDFNRERNVFAPFMGIPTATLSASSRLARSSGAVMLPYYPERKPDGAGYRLIIEPPLENFPSDDELDDATAINRSIEKFIRLYPESYAWIHQRFRTRPPGDPPFYS